MMKLPIISALLGLMLSASVAGKEVCPPRPSMSVLSTIGDEIDCDMCEKIMTPDTDFYQKCGTNLSTLILKKLVLDCKRILKTGNKAQMNWFWEDLNVACQAKSGLGSAYVKFDAPTCECDPCIELAKASGEFMQICAPNLTECELAEIFRTCRQKKNDYEALWLFYQDLKEQCFDLTGQNINLPLCDCDVCWLLFYETSDFMTKCGSQMNPDIVKKLLTSCEQIMCDPVELGYFKMNLELICARKLNVTFNFPQCACEECWKLFQSDSDFMQKCGSGMSNIMFMKLMETCYASMDSLDNFMAFLDNLELVCHQKSNLYFEKEWCECIDCLLIEDPTQPIWEDCIKELSDEDKIQFRHDCLDVMDDESGMAQFQEDLAEVCYCKTGNNVTFPECAECTRQDLCVVFVIDSSGSIDSGEFDVELTFVRNVIQAFGDNIGPGKTLIGLVQFSTSAKIELSLCNETDQNGVTVMIDYILNHKMNAMTSIEDGINKMNDDFDSCCAGNSKLKYGIVITDGWATEGSVQTAVNNTASDITLIAVGFGPADQNTLNIIGRNIQDNVFKVNTVDELDSLIESLKNQIGC